MKPTKKATTSLRSQKKTLKIDERQTAISGLCGGPDVHLPQRHFAQLEPGHAAGGLLGLRTLWCLGQRTITRQRGQRSQFANLAIHS